MKGIPFLHCGTWLRHALLIKGLRRVFLCGGESDFDNAYRWLAPWSELRAGRVIVFPARRRFVRGRWARIPCHPLIVDGISPLDRLRDALEPFERELASDPLYVSIDKDVLTAEDAAVNWDSGLLRLPEAVAVVKAVVADAGAKINGNLLYEQRNCQEKGCSNRASSWSVRKCSLEDRRRRQVLPGMWRS